MRECVFVRKRAWLWRQCPPTLPPPPHGAIYTRTSARRGSFERSRSPGARRRHSSRHCTLQADDSRSDSATQTLLVFERFAISEAEVEKQRSREAEKRGFGASEHHQLEQHSVGEGIESGPVGGRRLEHEAQKAVPVLGVALHAPTISRYVDSLLYRLNKLELCMRVCVHVCASGCHSRVGMC